MTATLQIGDRVVLRAEGGAPEAEFALFDPGDIELKTTEPGIVREVAYRTTAALAIQRLEMGGLTLALTIEAAETMLPSLVMLYARGPSVRRAAPRFGATELFESNAYDAEQRRYDGTWLDLPTLSVDVEVARASAFLQALHLRALLEEHDDETEVLLDTREVAARLRPGERSYRRISLEHIASFPSAIRAVGERRRTAPPGLRDEGPGRTVLLDAIRARAQTCVAPRAHERLAAIEAALAMRAQPARGPLSDPELWALEERLCAGDASGVDAQLDAIEKRQGRDPATSYLRARAALISGREAPGLVAEKAAAMAMAMSSFAELELLAAEAWAAAGQMKRAAPFARDLIDTPGVDEELRARAVQIYTVAQQAGISSLPPELPKGSTPAAPERLPSLPPLPKAFGQRSPASEKPTAPGFEAYASDRAFISVAPPNHDAPDLTLVQASMSSAPPPPDARVDGEAVRSSRAPVDAADDERTIRRRPGSFGPAPTQESRAPTLESFEAHPSSKPPPYRRSQPMRAVSAPPLDPRRSLLPRTQSSPDRMRGASQPPFREDSPAAHLHIPKAPRVPRTATAELASELSLPPGLQGQSMSSDVVPTSVIDARVHFTFLARQLGDLLRHPDRPELRADVAGIEAIQSHLLDSFPNGVVETTEQALDVQLYGAFLSEILARSLGAFWVDIAPADLGYWAMVVPPDTRVWPFGRILRFIAMAHKERDLVSYYLELVARAHKT